jgi:predicted PurR-regulated permease PerM
MTADQSPSQQEASGPLDPLTLPPHIEHHGIFRWFFFGAFAFLLWQLLLILSLFSDAIIWAVSLALVFAPFYRYLQQKMPARRNMVALISTLGVLLLVLLPLLIIFWIVVQQSAQLYPTVNGWLTELRDNGSATVFYMLPAFMQDFWLRIVDSISQNALLSQVDFSAMVLGNVDAVSLSIANFGAATARNILLGIVNLFLILVLMFFCFRDGERFLTWLFAIVPMSTTHVQDVALRVYQTITAVISGALVTAGAQGALAMIGYLLAGVPLAIFFGVLTGIAGMIPVVGAGLIWLPIGLFIFLDSPGWGIFILVWGFVFVSLIDNFLKPVIIGSQAHMPILLIFCAIIGGMNIYGFTGVIIGPILVALLLAFITIYRDYYLPGEDQEEHPEIEMAAVQCDLVPSADDRNPPG